MDMGVAIAGLGAAATAWLWTRQGMKDGVAGIADLIMQGVTAKANNRLGNNLNLAQSVLTRNEYLAAQNNPGIARMAYGNAVERLAAQNVRQSPILSGIIEPVGGPNNPDFVGRGLFSGLNFDITTNTTRAIQSHQARPNGPGLIILTYSRPGEFNLFP